MHKRTTLRALAAATMSLGLGLAAQSASAADTGPIKIGLVLPMTGQQASSARQIDAAKAKGDEPHLVEAMIGAHAPFTISRRGAPRQLKLGTANLFCFAARAK